jgi:hypothetical protein
MQTDSRKAAEAFIEKVVAPARVTRRSDPKAAQARAKLAREELGLAKRELIESALDPDRLDKLAAERSKSRKKLAEETRRRAIDASAAAARRLADLVPVILPAEPVETVIDQVTFIRSFAGQGRVLSSNIGPSDNWAKYRLESSSDSPELPGRLSFFTLWQNQQDTPTIVMARPNLVVNAYLSCDAEWNGVASWFGFTSQANATVRARTTVWNMDSSISAIVHDQVVGTAVARGNFFGDDSSDSIEFNEILSASGVTILPQAYSLIEVELVTEWQALSASVVLDAEGGSHRVDVPQLVLTEIPTPEPPPPISLTASVSYATSPAQITLTWSGATTSTVDVHRNGVLFTSTLNDGYAIVTANPGTYVFNICNSGTTVCSNGVSVTVTQ